MIADRVVTEFTEEDVKALGDNVVTILNAVKEMTQPEVMGWSSAPRSASPTPRTPHRTAVALRTAEVDARSANPPRPREGHGNAAHRRRGERAGIHPRKEVGNAHRHDCGP